MIDIKDREIIAITMFIIWKERCNRIFWDVVKPDIQLGEEVYNEWNPLH